MIPQDFEYSAPTTLNEALSLLADGSAKALAGGMSLIPMMKLRLAAPERLVDLSRVPDLSAIREDNGAIRVGAMATHYDIESSPLLRSKCPLLSEGASNIGDVQVRNMGTIGGSIAHSDPAADYPASLFALEARVRLISARGERTLPIGEFILDTLSTAIEPGEIVIELIVPLESAGAGVAYRKMVQPASGFAIVGTAARIHQTAGRIDFARIGITGLSSKAYRAHNVEKLLEGSAGSPPDIERAAAVVSDGVDANSDLHASADYRRQMARVYTARAVSQALSRAA